MSLPTTGYERIAQILQECASKGYSLLLRKAVLEIEGDFRPVGVEIIISGLPELDLRIHKAITFAQAEELPVFVAFLAEAFERFNSLVRLRAECLRIISDNPSGIRFANLEAALRSDRVPYPSSEKLLEMLQSLAANKLIRFALATYYPV